MLVCVLVFEEQLDSGRVVTHLRGGPRGSEGGGPARGPRGWFRGGGSSEEVIHTCVGGRMSRGRNQRRLGLKPMNDKKKRSSHPHSGTRWRGGIEARSGECVAEEHVEKDYMHPTRGPRGTEGGGLLQGPVTRPSDSS